MKEGSGSVWNCHGKFSYSNLYTDPCSRKVALSIFHKNVPLWVAFSDCFDPLALDLWIHGFGANQNQEFPGCGERGTNILCLLRAKEVPGEGVCVRCNVVMFECVHQCVGCGFASFKGSNSFLTKDPLLPTEKRIRVHDRNPIHKVCWTALGRHRIPASHISNPNLSVAPRCRASKSSTANMRTVVPANGLNIRPISPWSMMRGEMARSSSTFSLMRSAAFAIAVAMTFSSFSRIAASSPRTIVWMSDSYTNPNTNKTNPKDSKERRQCAIANVIAAKNPLDTYTRKNFHMSKRNGISSMITPATTAQVAKSNHQYASFSESDDRYLNDGLNFSAAAKRAAKSAATRLTLITRLLVFILLSVAFFGAICGLTNYDRTRD